MERIILTKIIMMNPYENVESFHTLQIVKLNSKTINKCMGRRLSVKQR